MKEKIIQLMKSEGLTPSRLAEILEIQPSGVSHLVSGRNKPGFDLLQKILRRFPNINPYWLMLDAENMYRVVEEEKPAVSVAAPVEEQQSELPPSVDLFSPPTPPAPATPVSPLSTYPGNPSFVTAPESSNIEQQPLRLKRVILLYEDGSCESYAVK